MSLYKDQNDKIHFIEPPRRPLADWVEVTQAEADEILHPPLSAEEAAAEAVRAVRAARASDMPEIGDVVDALCKGHETGDYAEFDVIQVLRNSVKAAHPKP